MPSDTTKPVKSVGRFPSSDYSILSPSPSPPSSLPSQGVAEGESHSTYYATTNIPGYVLLATRSYGRYLDPVLPPPHTRYRRGMDRSYAGWS